METYFSAYKTIDFFLYKADNSVFELFKNVYLIIISNYSYYVDDIVHKIEK